MPEENSKPKDGILGSIIYLFFVALCESIGLIGFFLTFLWPNIQTFFSILIVISIFMFIGYIGYFFIAITMFGIKQEKKVKLD